MDSSDTDVGAVHWIVLVATLLTLGPWSGSVAAAPPTRDEVVAVTRHGADGFGIYYTKLGQAAWHFVDQGADPALSPDGSLLAYTRVVGTGKQITRRIRVVDLRTGVGALLPEVSGGATQQYGAVWSPDGRSLYVHVCYPEERPMWTIGRFSYPTFEYSRVGELPPEVSQPPASSDGRFSLAVDIVPGYPGFEHDGPFGLLLVERGMPDRRTPLTPPGFLIGFSTCWLKATNEILFTGIWKPDSDQAAWHVYRINPLERNWAAVPQSEWLQKRVAEGQEVSCSRRTGPNQRLHPTAAAGRVSGRR